MVIEVFNREITGINLWMLKISALMGRVSIHGWAGHELDLFMGMLSPKLYIKFGRLLDG